MTLDHSQSSKSSDGQHARKLQQLSHRQKMQPSLHAMKSSLFDSAPTTTAGKRPTTSSGIGRSACGSLVQRRHSEALFCSHNPDNTLADSKDRTLSGLDESSGTIQNPTIAATDPSPNELSLEDGSVESSAGEAGDESETENMARMSSLVMRRQVIYYEGKLKTVNVQVWPDANRIPVHMRHKLQEPMKHRYGKLSHKNRLLKEFEMLKKRPTMVTVPLLPKRMRDDARLRLMAWYRPLNLPSTHRLFVSNDMAFKQPAQVRSQ